MVPAWLLANPIGVFPRDCRIIDFFYPPPVVSSLPHQADDSENHADYPYDKQDNSQCQRLEYRVHWLSSHVLAWRLICSIGG